MLRETSFRSAAIDTAIMDVRHINASRAGRTGEQVREQFMWLTLSSDQEEKKAASRADCVRALWNCHLLDCHCVRGRAFGAQYQGLPRSAKLWIREESARTLQYHIGNCEIQ
jgi:hypothetical protein